LKPLGYDIQKNQLDNYIRSSIFFRTAIPLENHPLKVKCCLILLSGRYFFNFHAGRRFVCFSYVAAASDLTICIYNINTSVFCISLAFSDIFMVARISKFDSSNPYFHFFLAARVHHAASTPDMKPNR
jgi:hypothetical protein